MSEPGRDHANPYGRLGGNYPTVVHGSGRTAPEGYCPEKICWCGQCDHYVPLKPVAGVVSEALLEPDVEVSGEESEFDEPSN